MKLGYGKKTLDFSLPRCASVRSLESNEVKVALTGEEEVARAIDNPIGSKPLDELLIGKKKVCIITSDVTRPCPSKVILKPLLAKLYSLGVKDEDIEIVFALGNHRKQTAEEMKSLVGEDVYQRIKCVDSDNKRVRHVGTTKAGTDVDIFEDVLDSDFIIALGNIEYHYFAGYSGGGKAIMPGVSTPSAIQENHSMMVLPSSHSGNIHSPVREDINEAAKMVGLDFIINVVLDASKTIVKAVAGDFIKAHKAGCDFLDTMNSVDIDHQADIVVVTPGGYPKDINMYQAQKALDNAKYAVKDGGSIIWVAECLEGFGNPTFEDWMLNKTPAQRVKDIKDNFVLGGHKAAAISLVQQKADIYFLSAFDDETVKKMGLIPVRSVEEAFELAKKKISGEPSLYLMEHGASTLPILK